MLTLLAVACGTAPVALEELYREGYRELESGNLDVAAEVAGQGLRRAEKEGQPGWVRAFEVLEAEIFVGRRQIASALDRLDDALSDGRPRDLVRGRALMTRGYARCLAQAGGGSGSSSSGDLEEAVRIAEALGDGKLVAEATLRHGTCAAAQGDLETAEALYRKSMEFARRHGLRLIASQAAGNLGNLLVGASRYDDAIRWLRRSQQRATGLSADGLRAKNLGILGWAYYRLGDYERAIQVLTEAEALARKLGYTGDRRIALINLGRTQRLLGDYGGASRSYTDAAAVALELGDPREAAEALASVRMTQAALALERRRHEEAASRAAEALRIQGEQGFLIDRQRTLVLQGQIWEHRGERSRAAALYEEVVKSPNAEPNMVWEARAALARVHAHANRPVDAEAEFRKAFELMEISFEQLMETELRLPFFSNLGRFHDEYVDFLITQGRVIEALQVADHSRARLLQERLLADGTVPGGAVDYARLARNLDAPVLFYWTAPERSFLWVITSGGVDLIPLAEEAVLDNLVAAYQSRILASRDPLGEADPAGVELYRRLVEPASAAIASAQRVFIVPDGPLHQLNFETLILPDPRAHYWIEDVALVRAPSLRLLPAGLESQRATEPSLLGLGDSTAVDEAFPSLPFAGAELSAVAELFEPERRRVYVGPQASPSAYREADSERFTFIHFAAHAQVNAVAPLDSAVVLSPEDDEYKLYARDIISIPLDAELVTLSACRSAGGRTFAGEGLVGLSWAFLSAGARHVIGGLWQVEDASTAELMTHLYRELVAGAEPAVALRRAKLELLRSDTAYRKPYYWAPFVTYTSRAGSQSQMRSTASNRSAQESSSSASSGSSPSASEATASSARAPSKST